MLIWIDATPCRSRNYGAHCVLEASGAGAIEFAGLGGEGYKLPRAEYAPKHTSNTPCYFSNTLGLVNSYVNSQMKRRLPEECVYSAQVATCKN